MSNQELHDHLIRWQQWLADTFGDQPQINAVRAAMLLAAERLPDVSDTEQLNEGGDARTL